MVGSAAVGLIVLVWASAALGSYVYLKGMGYSSEFSYPWDELWVALPWIFMGGWQGISTLVIWEWAAIGVASSIMPLLFVATFWIRRLRDKAQQPSLWGSTGFADRREMDRGGIKTTRRPF